MARVRMVRSVLALAVAALPLAVGPVSAAPHGGPVGASTHASVPAADPAPVDPGAFVGVSPARVLDTRVGLGAARATVRAHGTVHLQVTGAGGVPDGGVAAVVLNVTVTNPTSRGYVTAYPDGVSRPTASNVNVVAGQTVANLVVVGVGGSGRVALYNGTGGSVDLIADVAGYYLAGAPVRSGGVRGVVAGAGAGYAGRGWVRRGRRCGRRDGAPAGDRCGWGARTVVCGGGAERDGDEPDEPGVRDGVSGWGVAADGVEPERGGGADGGEPGGGGSVGRPGGVVQRDRAARWT